MVAFSSGEPAEAVYRRVVAADPCLDHGLTLRSIRVDHPQGAALGKALRARLGLDAQTWVLLGRAGVVLASGRTPPSPEDLDHLLEGAGEPSRVGVLQAFLREHPSHWEALLDLVRALGPRLRGRLEAAPTDRDLTPEEDGAIWGPITHELERLLRAMPLADLPLGGTLLPPGAPERRSPAMRGLYLRHRPAVQDGLRRLPAAGALWQCLLRMDEALGERSAARLWPTLAWSSVDRVDAVGFPAVEVARSLVAEARSSGEWSCASAGLATLWTRFTQPALKAHEEAGPSAPGLAFREAALAQVLEPWFEAKLRTGAEVSNPGLLRGLDPAILGGAVQGRLDRLARKLGKGHLADHWPLSAAGQGRPPGGLPSTEHTLFHVAQECSGAAENQDLALAFHKLGQELVVQEAPPHWARFLGWPSRTPRWALVDGQGTILLQGTTLPDAQALLAAWRARGGKMELEALVTFRKENPDHLGALARECQLRGRIAWTCAGAGGEEAETAWRAYAGCLESLLGDPLGTEPLVLDRVEIHLPVPGAEDGLKALWSHLANQALPRLEEALAHRPGAGGLWRAWLALAPHGDRSPVALLEALTPLPGTSPDVWPPDAFVQAVVGDLSRLGRWQELAQFLLPRLDARRQMVEAGCPEGNRCRLAWSWGLAHALLEALLRLGRLQQAQETLGVLTKHEGIPKEEQEPLLAWTRAMGEEDLGRRWLLQSGDRP